MQKTTYHKILSVTFPNRHNSLPYGVRSEVCGYPWGGGSVPCPDLRRHEGGFSGAADIPGAAFLGVFTLKIQSAIHLYLCTCLYICCISITFF